MKNRLLLLFLTTLALASCTDRKKLITRKWLAKEIVVAGVTIKVDEVPPTSDGKKFEAYLELDEDGDYEFMFPEDYEHPRYTDKVKGEWRINDDVTVLTLKPEGEDKEKWKVVSLNNNLLEVQRREKQDGVEVSMMVKFVPDKEE